MHSRYKCFGGRPKLILVSQIHSHSHTHSHTRTHIHNQTHTHIHNETHTHPWAHIQTGLFPLFYTKDSFGLNFFFNFLYVDINSKMHQQQMHWQQPFRCNVSLHRISLPLVVILKSAFLEGICKKRH